MLSVPYAPRGGPRPSKVFAQMGGDERPAETNRLLADWLASLPA
ncbi:hypothetical protein GCM10010347_41220 [Streptomyces cirratus]|uniref:Uncharacterized protein n=1 Tax=Streptomyces cirratus TaxID=68187 RepID=A0ABQ3EZU8_9ACTN|nr:hypothetical protein GCM10010347_41220 [Streptomyces cirratus]